VRNAIPCHPAHLSRNRICPLLRRRLKLACPQRPGIVLAITELLRDYGCTISEIDASTVNRSGELWFELECIVDLPDGIDPQNVGDDLQFWTESAEDRRTTLVFDTCLTPNFAPLSHA